MNGKQEIEFVVRCPHCQEQMTLPAYLGVGTARAGSRPDFKKDGWTSRLDATEVDLLAQMELDGTVAAYAAAFREQSNNHEAPADLGFSMWGFFARCVEAKLPVWATARYRRELKASNIRAWIYNGVVAIVADGALREFTPVKILKDSTSRPMGKTGPTMKVAASPERLEVWRKTRHGYVAVGTAFATMMSRRSIGAFADVS